jgi:hypothetical protein
VTSTVLVVKVNGDTREEKERCDVEEGVESVREEKMADPLSTVTRVWEIEEWGGVEVKEQEDRERREVEVPVEGEERRRVVGGVVKDGNDRIR